MPWCSPGTKPEQKSRVPTFHLAGHPWTRQKHRDMGERAEPESSPGVRLRRQEGKEEARQSAEGLLGETADRQRGLSPDQNPASGSRENFVDVTLLAVLTGKCAMGK